MIYEPKPLDLSGPPLDPALQALSEQLAKAIHERWAWLRMQEGWVYGLVRDDSKKEHPDLVPYEQLPEAEKEYDRQTAMETIRALVSLDYRIEQGPLGAAPDRCVTSQEPLESLIDLLKQDRLLDLSALMGLWYTRNPDSWARKPEIYILLGRTILKHSEPLLAYDVFKEGLRHLPTDLCLKQQMALSLARSGAVIKANQILREMVHQGHHDEETLGLLARTYKDIWLQSGKTQADALDQSNVFYSQAYQETSGLWSGINATTTAFLLGRKEESRNLANEVKDRCLRAMAETGQPSGDPDYWLLATLGEASLLLGQLSEVESWFGKAVAAAGNRFGDISTTRKNARLLMEQQSLDPVLMEKWLPVPRITVFINELEGGERGFLRDLGPQVEEELRKIMRTRIKAVGPGIAFGSGGLLDLLYLEEVHLQGGEVHVILPYGRNQYILDHFSEQHQYRFEQLLAKASQVVVASEQQVEEGNIADIYADLLMNGLASIKARQLETQLVPVVAHPQQDAGKPSEAQGLAGFWKRQGCAIEHLYLGDVIDLSKDDIGHVPKPVNNKENAAARGSGFKARIVAIMFADVVHYSKLREEEIQPFVEGFLKSVAGLLSRDQCQTLSRNTWGDGLYLVFASINEAGRFALKLSDMVNQTRWADHGLPAEFNIRISLHAGPVYECMDPVTEKMNFIGTHVSRAARIEPITPPGQVYASQAFAALSAAGDIKSFVCEYVGMTSWAKGYGTFPTYHVRGIDWKGA